MSIEESSAPPRPDLRNPGARFKAVTFDLDGTLANTLPAMEVSWNEVLEPIIGRTISQAEIVERLGPRAVEIMRVYVPDNPDEISQLLSDRFVTTAKVHARLYPRVEELIETLLGRGIAVGVVTSMGREAAIALLTHFGLIESFSVVVTADDVARMKPDPEPILMAAEALGLDPTQLLMVGDNPTDMEAARAAGAGAGAAAWGFYGRKAATDADWVFDEPYDVLTIWAPHQGR